MLHLLFTRAFFLVLLLQGGWSVASAAYLPPRGPAPLRWRPQPSAPTTTPIVAAPETLTPSPTQHVASTTSTLVTPPADLIGPPWPPPGTAQSPGNTTAPAESISLATSSASTAGHSPTSPDTHHAFVAPDAPGDPVEPSQVSIAGTANRQMINAQMLVRFFQSPDPALNPLLNAAAGAAPAPATANPAGAQAFSLFIPVQFVPPEPFGRPPGAASSTSTYSVTPKP